MSTDNKQTAPHNAGEKKSRDDLLNELESIRNLLDDSTSPEPHEKPRTAATGHIPLLIPDDSIPTLGLEHRHHDNSARRAQKTQNSVDKNLSTSTRTHLSSTRSREKLVDDVVRSAMPRLEALLRELVQEALLQEKLRGGKR